MITFRIKRTIEYAKEFDDFIKKVSKGELLDEEKTEALRRKSFIFMDIKVKKGEEK